MKIRIKTKAIRKILAEKNMGQNSLARVVKITNGHASQIINGKRNASPAVRQRILDVLKGVSYHDIFTAAK